MRAHARVRACMRACVPACLRACVPACSHASRRPRARASLRPCFRASAHGRIRSGRQASRFGGVPGAYLKPPTQGVPQGGGHASQGVGRVRPNIGGGSARKVGVSRHKARKFCTCSARKERSHARKLGVSPGVSVFRSSLFLGGIYMV